MYSFEWDEHKNISNFQKHGVTFEEASTVFYDEKALVEYDDEHSEFEDRFKIIGDSSAGNTLIVVHCEINDTILRIISARKASTIEEKAFRERSNRYG